jgi:hypothetical protein
MSFSELIRFNKEKENIQKQQKEKEAFQKALKNGRRLVDWMLHAAKKGDPTFSETWDIHHLSERMQKQLLKTLKEEVPSDMRKHIQRTRIWCDRQEIDILLISY